MKSQGRYLGASYSLDGELQVTFAIDDREEVEKLEKIKEKELLIEAGVLCGKRSVNANDLMWKCLDIIAKSPDVKSDKWTIYLQMLKKYGKFTYIIVNPSAVAAMKEKWRETEELGEINVNGRTGVQLICYYGSSTYNTKEFSDLLDGIISDMKDLGLSLPPREEVETLLKEWGEIYMKKG